MKGVSKVGYDVTANLVEMLPYIGALPIRTLGVLTVIWIDRHPTGAIAQTAEKVAGKVSIRKKVGGKTVSAKSVPSGINVKNPVGTLPKPAPVTDFQTAKANLTKRPAEVFKKAA